ncbi:hypothetical protein ACOSP7_005227 [Xanthoceras sorbifolium]
MDHRSWLWRKRSSEKMILAANKVDLTLNRIGEEVQKGPADKEMGPENSMRNLNEKLASVLLDCHPKDSLVTNPAKPAQEAIAGMEKPAAEAAVVEKEVDKAFRHGIVNEKPTQADAALMKHVQHINFVREEEEQKICDAVMKASSEFEKVQKDLEKNLAEAHKSLAKLAADNSHLNKALVVKERLIGDLNKKKSQAEAEFNTLMARLDTIEKENAFLKYEHRILEKELEIRNEEMEYTRRSVDAAHKQQLESVKQITKLEAECQRLRLLMRKKPPGPAASAKIKGEVEMLSRDQMEMRRRKLNPSRDLIVRETPRESFPQISSKMSMIERLQDMEEENRSLKEIVTSKSTELQASRMMYSRTASRLSCVEAQLKEICKGRKPLELARYGPISSELSIKLVDNGSDDGFSSPGSWATALISELEHFKDGKIKNQLERKAIEVPDMSLMDDFVEMEKLAVVSTETPCGGDYHPDVTCKELVPVEKSDSNAKQEIRSQDMATEKSFDWLQVVLNAILKQKCISKQSLDELLEDIRIALGYINHPGESDSLHFGGYITSKSSDTSPAGHAFDATYGIDPQIKESSQHLDSNLSMSICKIIELIEGINIRSAVSYNTSDNLSEKDSLSLTSAAPVDYFVHVFRWKSSELSTVLQKFIRTCNDLLNGKADLQKFVREFSFALNWITNNCIAPKDASSARNNIKKHFGWNESPSENEVGVGTDDLRVESNAAYTSEDQSSCLCSAVPLDHQNILFQTECVQGNLQEENRRLKDELKNIEARLECATDKSKTLMTQLHETKENIGNLESEVKTLKESKEMVEDQIENQNSINEDLDTQLTVCKAKLSEVFQKFSSLEVELEYKNNCCEELEATCLELQLQLESVAKKEPPNHCVNQDGKVSQNGWEITEASVKLAECQETILNLGKQLKALASPRDAALFDKVFPTTNPATTTTNNKKLNKHFSLRDQMLAEDGAKAETVKCPNDKGTSSIEDTLKPSLPHSSDGNDLDTPKAQVRTPEAHPGSKNKPNNIAVGSLAIVPSKKRGVGLLMKLLLRRKKGSSKNS